MYHCRLVVSEGGEKETILQGLSRTHEVWELGFLDMMEVVKRCEELSPGGQTTEDEQAGSTFWAINKIIIINQFAAKE